MNPTPQRLEEPILNHIRRDFASLQETMTVQQALEAIRQQNPGEAIIYFYVTDTEGRLTGVLPTRRLLTAPLDRPLAELMVRRVAAINHTATLLDACEFFVLYKLLAFPVIDENRHILGTVDVNVFTEKVFDIAAKDEAEETEDVFDAIGFHVELMRGASPLKAFRLRFPWLLATVGSGILCALLAGAFEATLAKSVVLAFFLALVLGLGESVCIQSVALTIQSLRAAKPSWSWYWTAFRREASVALLLGGAISIIVFLLVWIWRGNALAGLAIGASIIVSLMAACVFGLTVPALLHAWKVDPKVAAGPISLAVADIFSLLFYFSIGTWLL